MSGPLNELFEGEFAGKRVLVTGHTGFKGSWLALWLAQMGAEVHGLALAPYTDRDLFVVARVEEAIASHTICDVRDAEAVSRAVSQARPELVLHLAAQPLVRHSYEHPAETYDINVTGTAHLLDAVLASTDGAPPPTIVITSDKCYRNDERPEPYTESDPLGGHDPYSSSKACQELLSAAYRDSFFAPRGAADQLKTVRAGNVVGGGDWAADRIVPDAVRALGSGDPIGVRNPASVRPWQHVLEPLGGYLALAARLLGGRGDELGPAYNFGPEPDSHLTVGQLMDEFVSVWGSGSWQHAPEPGAVHEAALLTLDASRARQQLGWAPVLTADEAVRVTAEWYRAQADGADMRQVTVGQMTEYSQRAASAWRATEGE